MQHAAPLVPQKNVLEEGVEAFVACSSILQDADLDDYNDGLDMGAAHQHVVRCYTPPQCLSLAGART